MFMKPLPSWEELHEAFDYVPSTGILYWLVSRPPVSAGDIACPKGRVVRFKGFLYFKHRIIWKWMTGDDPGDRLIDHADLDQRNNKWLNLRMANHPQNTANTGAYRNNLTGLKGVCLQAGKYIARAQKDGVNYYLGYFGTPEEAHAAYLKKHRELFGEFARAA